MSRKDDIRKLIINYERRLQKLKEQLASFGLHTPPHILVEIEDIEAKINELSIKLKTLPNYEIGSFLLKLFKGKGKVITRGVLVLMYLFIFITVTIWAFSSIYPFGSTFVYDSFDGAQEVPLVWQLLLELLSVISIETLTNLFLLIIAVLVGFIGVLIVAFLIKTFTWILDAKI